MAIRNDVSSLLDRLGRQDLRYREFSDPLGDMEMWPIFEALLQDRRIVGEASTPLDQRRRTADAQQRIKAAPPPAGGKADAGPAIPYSPPSPPRPAAAADDPQVRAFFGQLGARGIERDS
ncbi:hypothetical protein [Croceibacterium mercuriale]|uniref:hypothetical protein n=1 Tax=Croceibacterium mercuriale TaxID=1572751 RepID=UPI00068CEE0E|nr:hypothetical protein [Croceibacterium mercuriale]